MTRLIAAFLGFAIFIAEASAERQDADAHLSRGTQLLHEQMFQEAAREFEQALVTRPADPQARFQYAVCLLSLGRNQEARAQLQQVQKQAGDSPYITYYMGRLDLLSNDYVSAIQRLNSIAEKPPFPDTAFQLGVAYISSGDVSDGVKWLERAAKILPNDYRTHYRLARAYSVAGRQQEAAQQYDLYSKLLNEHKSTESEVRACADSLHDKAQAAAHDACHRMFDPNDPEKLTLLGQLYGDAGDYQQAIEPLAQAVHLDPNSYEAWHNLGLTYFRLQRYRDARMPLEHAVKLRPDSYGSVVTFGATLYMLGEDDAALPVLERAHQLNPRDTQTAAVLEKLRAERTKK